MCLGKARIRNAWKKEIKEGKENTVESVSDCREKPIKKE